MTPPKHDRAAAQMTDALRDRIVARMCPSSLTLEMFGLRKAITEARRMSITPDG